MLASVSGIVTSSSVAHSLYLFTFCVKAMLEYIFKTSSMLLTRREETTNQSINQPRFLGSVLQLIRLVFE